MALTKEKKDAIQKDFESLSSNLEGLTEEELKEVAAGTDLPWIKLFIETAPSLGFLGAQIGKIEA